MLPDSLIFFNSDGQSIDVTIQKTKYRIVMYVDSIGCISCKLKLAKWKQFIVDVDSLSERNTSFLFIFYPKMKKDIFMHLEMIILLILFVWIWEINFIMPIRFLMI